MNYLEAYNASEGFFAIQDQKKSKEMLLMLDYGVFYEFIKKENLNHLLVTHCNTSQLGMSSI